MTPHEQLEARVWLDEKVDEVRILRERRERRERIATQVFAAICGNASLRPNTSFEQLANAAIAATDTFIAELDK